MATCWMRGPLPTKGRWARELQYCCTQTELYSELLPPRSRPKNFWALYKEYLQANEEANSDTSEVADLQDQVPE